MVEAQKKSKKAKANGENVVKDVITKTLTASMRTNRITTKSRMHQITRPEAVPIRPKRTLMNVEVVPDEAEVEVVAEVVAVEAVVAAVMVMMLKTTVISVKPNLRPAFPCSIFWRRKYPVALQPRLRPPIRTTTLISETAITHEAEAPNKNQAVMNADQAVEAVSNETASAKNSIKANLKGTVTAAKVDVEAVVIKINVIKAKEEVQKVRLPQAAEAKIGRHVNNSQMAKTKEMVVEAVENNESHLVVDAEVRNAPPVIEISVNGATAPTTSHNSSVAIIIALML